MRSLNPLRLIVALALLAIAPSAIAETAAVKSPVALTATKGLHPNLTGQLDKPLRYRPQGEDFVIENGTEFFNRTLYGGNTAFRVDGGDRPEFLLYLPGRGGNLRLGVRTKDGLKWLKDADHIVTRYRPGELIYEIRDKTFGPHGVLMVEALAYADTEGLIVKAKALGVSGAIDLVWAYGGVTGVRGARDGDIGTEKVPISDYFQFTPEFAQDNMISLSNEGFILKSDVATIAGVLPQGAKTHLANADLWDDLSNLAKAPLGPVDHPILFGEVGLTNDKDYYLSLQRLDYGKGPQADLETYREVTQRTHAKTENLPLTPLLPVFHTSQVSEQFERARNHFQNLRNKVRVDTPDPYLNAAIGSLNIVADALWDARDQAIMHGSIAWRTKLLGWRGPYALDALGWHDRARQNFETWRPNQNVQDLPTNLPPADEASNLARNEAGLHSNGDLSNSHYDMNMVFIDALLRHLLWTGDKAYARQVWPTLQRHLAWEKRLFRREFGPDKLPLYEAYATLWASDDLYYGGGGTSHASAYNVYANKAAARIANLIGEDPGPYAREAQAIELGMRTYLWLPGPGAYAEYKDLLGLQRVHPDYALWTFYHTIDEEAANAREAWRMGRDLPSHLKPIPVVGDGVPNDLNYHVYATSDWMPYTWSINNVVMDENLHTALALWQAGHSKDAFVLTKSAILASMYMGISPGNVGTMNYLDVYRRESQRDFGDAAGTLSRALIEGLFGVRPDALSGTLTLAPGFPQTWTHARLDHPDFSVAFERRQMTDVWQMAQTRRVFTQAVLRLPASFTAIQFVEVNGIKAKWNVDRQAVGRPILEIRTPIQGKVTVRIVWSGQAIGEEAQGMPTGRTDADFAEVHLGDFSWWTPRIDVHQKEASQPPALDWSKALVPEKMETVDLAPHFNAQVSHIFARGKYLSPRSPGVSLALPSQGIGAWAGHVNLLPEIDDTGLRHVAARQSNQIVMPNGVMFATPGSPATDNIVFTSRWDNYPNAVEIPLGGSAKRLFLLMAGTTNAMQSRIDNAEVIVSYSDGTTDRLALRNPETWWPIEQDYFIDDYQFPDAASLPPRIDLKTGSVRLPDAQAFKGKGRDVMGGAATALSLDLDPTKTLQSLTLRTLSNDVIVGLMSVTLQRP